MRRAFTLIELLVVIAIIALLSTLSVVALNSARAKSRDARRLSDIRTIRTALDMYYNSEGRYPATISVGSSITSTAGEVYLTKVPTNPNPRTDNGCLDVDYIYTPSADFSNYTLTFCLGNNTSDLVSGSWLADANGYRATTTAAVVVEFTCGQTITDSRDGSIYPTVLIGSQCWLAKNLAYLPSVNLVADGSDSESRYYVSGYNGTDANAARSTPNYSTYGVLYNWPASMQGSASSAATPSGVQGICPTGWHIPSDTEWTNLATFLGNGVGSLLKEGGSAHWTSNSCVPYGCNSTGFTALGGSIRNKDGYFDTLTYFAHFWSSTIDGSNVWERIIRNNSYLLTKTSIIGSTGCSVRCLKD